VQVGLGLGHIVLDGDTVPPPKGAQPRNFGPCLLWPNCWMDQDATWYGGRPQPRRIGLDGDSALLNGALPPIFGPCLLWLNGWVDQDAIWYRGIPRSRPHCVNWDPAPSPRKEYSRPLPSLLGPYLLWPNGRPSQLLLSSCYYNHVTV